MRYEPKDFSYVDLRFGTINISRSIQLCSPRRKWETSFAASFVKISKHVDD